MNDKQARWLALYVLCLGDLMIVLDTNIVNVALPSIQADLGFSQTALAWVVNAYMLTFGGFLLLSGRLGDLFGNKRVFLGGVVSFSAASIACGIAPSPLLLVLGRAVQGLGGAAVSAVALALIMGLFTDPAERAKAMGFFGFVMSGGGAVGVLAGGVLTGLLNWHWIFLVNVPIGLTVAFLIPRVLQEPGFTPDTTRIDATGIGLLAIGMASLQYVLEEGNREGWTDSTRILVLAAIAAIAIITFIVHELEAPHPVVDLRVFKNRSYSAGTGLNFLLGLAVFGAAYLFSLYCGAVMRYQALDIGRVFLLAGASQIFLMPLIGKLANRLDPRLMLVLGVGFTTLSQYVASHLTSDAAFIDLVVPNIIRSFGLAFVFIPVSVAALSDLPLAQRGNATGLFNLTRELGGSLGTAWMGKVVADGITTHSARLAEHVSPYNPVAQAQWLGIARGGMDPPTMLAGRVLREAMVLSFEDGFRITMTAIGLGIVMVMLLKRPAPQGAPTGAH
jgi:MFS transporter, DHA2 family, multidrug resistance protein